MHNNITTNEIDILMSEICEYNCTINMNYS